MRDLPRQLSVAELSDLFGGSSPFVERLAKEEYPLARAGALIHGLPYADKIAAIETHPRIGERSTEQHGDEPEVLAELEALNNAYEQKFGFRFIVFVNRRPRRDLLPILRERLERTREQEVETALDELIAIARDRWSRR